MTAILDVAGAILTFDISIIALVIIYRIVRVICITKKRASSGDTEDARGL